MLEDYFLNKLTVFLLPILLIFTSTILITFLIIKRYSRALTRLYKMNFHGVENERKRIANDLHDQIGFTITQVRSSLELASEKTQNTDSHYQINLAQIEISDLHLTLRQLIENIYPRELMYANWKYSFEMLANRLSIGDRKVEMSIDVEKEIGVHQLNQLFRLTQEILSNIYTHAAVQRINVQIYEDNKDLVLSFTYKNNKGRGSKHKLLNLNGRGLFIISERINLLGGIYKIFEADDYFHQVIKFKI